MSKLSQREKLLSVVVGGALLLIVTFFLADAFMKRNAAIRAALTKQNRELKSLQAMSSEKAMWDQRDAWLRDHQPKLTNEDSAGVNLLGEIKELAKKHTVLLDSPRILPTLMRKTDYTAVTIEIETKSTWRSLIAFLGELQNPEQFVVLDSANLKIDTADNTQMRGKFRIARWYAPK